MAEVVSPLHGAVVRVVTAPGERVESSSPVVVVESMKMEYVVEAGVAGTVGRIAVEPGDPVQSGDVLAVVEAREAAEPAEAAE
ncbi:MAG TPA: biotin/lipoyl-containing protein, partial [Acidimicrobiales bacterium]|nr:biotin/lipoyl-containing protein [Acidimicrobiales bacterium]